MNWLDIVILIVLLISIVMGIRAGVIKVLFTLAGGIIGVVLAGRYSDSLGSKLTFISSSSTANIAAFVIILVVVMLIAAILAFVLKKIAAAILLGWVDKLAGGVLGLVLGALFMGAILTMWIKFQGGSDVVTGSALSRFLLDKFPVVLGLLPSEFKSVRDFFH
jgi:membrane protein required for colicin V production